jgi:hypothetical protein
MFHQVQQPPPSPNDTSKVKVKLTLEQATKVQREKRGKAQLLASLVDGVDGYRHDPITLPLEKDPVPIVQYKRLGGPQGRSGHVWKISPPTGIRSPDLPARSESLYRLRSPGLRCHS